MPTNDLLAVLMLSEVGPEIPNGVARSLELTCGALGELGHQPIAVVPTHPDATRQPWVIRVPSLSLGVSREYRIALPFCAPGIWWTLLTRRFDLYHTHHLFTLGLFARLMSWLRGVPCIATYHTYMVGYVHYLKILPSSWRKALAAWWSRIFLNLMDGVAVPSKTTERILRGYGVRAPMAVVPTGIRPEDFTRHAGNDQLREFMIDPTKFSFVAVGRLADEKNVELILRAFAQIWEDEQLVIIGDGPSRAKLEALVEELGIRDGVRFTGMLENTTAWAIAGRCQVAVSASATEMQGLIYAEAAEKGIPRIAVGALAACDAIDHEVTGLLVPNNVHALAQAMWELRRDTDTRARLAAAAKADNPRFWLTNTIQDLLVFYRQVIHQHQNGA